MSRTKLFLDVVEELQGLTESLRILAQTLATDETPEPTPKPPKKAKTSPKKEVAPEPAVVETPEPVVEETPEQSKTPESVVEEVTPEPEPTPSQEEVPPEPEPPVKAITFEELRGAMATKSQKGKKAEVKALLTKYGVEKLSEIPVESYSEVMAEVEAL